MTDPIVDYQVVFSDWLGEMEEEVRNRLRAGWEVQGGVAYGQGKHYESGEVVTRDVFAQAMVLRQSRLANVPAPPPAP